MWMFCSVRCGSWQLKFAHAKSKSAAAGGQRLCCCYPCQLLTMKPLWISVLLGLTAALANTVGGAIIIQKHWHRSYLKYFVALGSGFMLATALVEMVPESLRLNPGHGGFLILLGYLLVHFFEHTIAPHFHFGEEVHQEEFARAHRAYSVV